MLQYDSKKRLNAHSLCNHAFLRKNIKEFNNIDLTKLKKITIEENSKILINTKENENIRENFGIWIIDYKSKTTKIYYNFI